MYFSWRHHQRKKEKKSERKRACIPLCSCVRVSVCVCVCVEEREGEMRIFNRDHPFNCECSKFFLASPTFCLSHSQLNNSNFFQKAAVLPTKANHILAHFSSSLNRLLQNVKQKDKSDAGKFGPKHPGSKAR